MKQTIGPDTQIALEVSMSSELLSNAVSNTTREPLSQILQRCFHKRKSGWFVQHSEQNSAGPFADKADAQMAMLYYSARTLWPSEKQLREFARNGK